MKQSGVYKITCIENGKFYIGSSKNIKQRWINHRTCLRRNKYHPTYFQQAWNRYGESRFVFEVVELCAEKHLLSREQHYLDTLTPWDPQIGFNVNRIAGKPIVWNNIKLTLKDSAGELHTTSSITEFASKYRLDYVSLLLLYHKKILQYKGWTLPSTKLNKKSKFKLRSSTGEVVYFSNQSEFARRYGITPQGVCSVLKGRIHCYKGWSLPKGIKRSQKLLSVEQQHFKLRSPANKIFNIEYKNRGKFCKEHGINVEAIRRMRAGITKSHKGWTIV